MQRRFLILANPIAGGGRGKSAAGELAACLGRLGCASEVYFSRQGGDLGRRAATLRAGDVDGVLVAGGDGSVLEVLNGMPDPSLPIGHLPMGTANVLAVELGLPWRPAQLARLAAENRHRPHRIGLCNGTRFLLFASTGLDAHIVQHLEAHRSGTLGMRKWAPSVWHVVRNWPQPEVTAILPDGERISGLSQALVTRVRSYGGLLTLPPGIDPQADELHLIGFRAQGRLAWIWLLLRALCGQLQTSPRIIHRRCRSLRLEPGDVPYQLDGDLGGRGAMDLSMLEEPARIFAPGPRMP